MKKQSSTISVTPDSPKNSAILTLVKNFNQVLKRCITGPNCIDPNLCKGDCCFIQIDVPKKLAKYYVDHQLAQPHHFQRGNVFSFKIRIDLNTCKCVFFDAKLNGCSLHSSGMKPPQCWIYPTGLDPSDTATKCKKLDGWKIIDEHKAKTAQQYLEEYIQQSKTEAIRINSRTTLNQRLNKNLKTELMQKQPSKVSGVKDGWNSFHPLDAEGFSMGLKMFCDQIQCNKNFLSCSEMCEPMISRFLSFLHENLALFVKNEGFKEPYTIMEVLESQSKRDHR